jgi:hypothetical protein
MSPEEVSREVREMAVLEYETAVENGMGRQEAWAAIVELAGEAGPAASLSWASQLAPLGDPVECYRTHTFDQIAARLASGDFASCGRCRRTYVVDHAVMRYAAGLYLSDGRARPVLVYPGRKVLAGSDPALEGAQEYGLIDSWQLGPWALDGMPSQ